jgi:hypothetical protein
VSGDAKAAARGDAEGEGEPQLAGETEEGGIHPVYPIFTGVFTAVSLGFGIAYIIAAGNVGEDEDAVETSLGGPDAAEQRCEAPGFTTRDACAQRDSLSKKRGSHTGAAITSFVFAGLGAAATVTFVVLMFAGDDDDGESDTGLMPVVGPTAAGLTWSRAF